MANPLLALQVQPPDMAGVQERIANFQRGQSQQNLLNLQLQQAETGMKAAAQVRQLMPAALYGDKEALKQLAGVDPAKAMEVQTYLRDKLTTNAKAIAETMEGLAYLSPEQQQATYLQRINLLESQGVDVSGIPEKYDENIVDLMRAVAGLPKETAETLVSLDLPASLQTGPYANRTQVSLRKDNPEIDRLIAAGATKTRGKGQTINVGPQGVQYGNPPTDHAWKRNKQGEILVEPILDEAGDVTGYSPVAVPIKGGPAEAEIQKAARKRASLREQRKKYAEIVITDSNKAIDMLEADKDRFIPLTGIGSYMQLLPGTDQRDLSELVKTLEANAAFDRLQEMRDASPTGGALGQVSEMELELLKKAIGSLDMAQSREQFLANLKRVRGIYMDIIHEGKLAQSLREVEQGDVPDFSGQATLVGGTS